MLPTYIFYGSKIRMIGPPECADGIASKLPVGERLEMEDSDLVRYVINHELSDGEAMAFQAPGVMPVPEALLSPADVSSVYGLFLQEPSLAGLNFYNLMASTLAEHVVRE